MSEIVVQSRVNLPSSECLLRNTFIEPTWLAFSPMNSYQFANVRIINAYVLCSHFREDKLNAEDSPILCLNQTLKPCKVRHN